MASESVTRKRIIQCWNLTFNKLFALGLYNEICGFIYLAKYLAKFVKGSGSGSRQQFFNTNK